MVFLYKILLFLLAANFAARFVRSQEVDYCNVTSCGPWLHVMCEFPAPADKSVCSVSNQSQPLTKKEKTDLLDWHNTVRSNVTRTTSGMVLGGGFDRPVNNMLRMKWSTELERFAQRWADQCIVAVQREHDGCRNTMPPDNRCYLENGGSAENFFVSEDLPVGAFIGTLRIHGDPREHVGNIVLSLKESDSPVSIAPGTKNITLSRKLDKEGVDGPNSVYINVICDLSRTSDPGFVIPVVIRVTDANDNAPLFVNAPYVLNISEVTVVGTRVLQGVKAVDADQQGPYSTVQYSVLAGPHADYFVFVNGLEGTLLLRKPLDYETLTNFTIRIRAQDQGSPAKFSDTYLFVNVIDADDQNPRFFDDRYSAVLPDSSLEGAHLRVQPRDIQAYDQDTGINAAIFYSFNSKGTDYRFFDIDRATGQVVVKKPIHESDLMQPATLVIRATQFDNPDRYALATLTVARPGTSLKDLQFLQETYAVGVLENVPLHSVLVTVVTNHPRDKSFWLDDRTGTFGVNTGGDILLTKSLDFETQDRFTFKVHVTDGIMNDTARINISVLNVNDWDPRFRHPQYDFYVGETGVEPGAVVGRVEAADGDRGDFVVLELRGPGAGMFDVNADGEIILLDMDMLNSSTAHLVIVATDNGIPPRQASAPVVVHFPDAVVRKAGSSWSPGGTSFLLMLVFGSLLGILALVIALLILYIYKHKRNKTASETGSEAGYGVEEEKQPEVLGARNGKVDNPVFAAGATLQERLQLAHTATVKSLAARNATMRTGNHVSSASLAALPSPKSRLAPAPPLPPAAHAHSQHSSPTSSESPRMRRDNNNGELKVAWPGGSIPRRVKKLSWDDDQQSKPELDPEVSVTPLTNDQPSTETMNLTVYF